MTAMTKTATAAGVTALAIGALVVMNQSGDEINSPPMIPASVVPIQGFAITAMTRTGSVTHIYVTTEANYFYALQGATNVINPTWLDLYAQSKGNGGTIVLSDYDPANKKFYRVWRGTAPKPPPPYSPGTLSTTNAGEVL